MADSVRQTLRMIFSTEDPSRNFIITINNPRDNVTQEEVTQVMTNIITRDVFQAPGGRLMGIVDAQIVNRNVQDLVP
ncbi:MAG: DUF2922 domain-containing protein [Coprothermobacterota bacterium]|nr:DUF2922 domain-containing protein [Caldisericota bacterium]MDI6868162.1 DUF2922 domain-containing protein [Coprothermobacterota bacterium]